MVEGFLLSKESGVRELAKRKTNKKKLAKRLLWAIFFTGAAGIFCAMAVYVFVLINGSQFLRENIDKIVMPEASIIYDRNGNETMKLYVENRESVALDEVPQLLKDAFIATEDKRFEEHEGVDYIAVARALVTDVMHRSAVQGASTITQQLAKNLFLTNEKTIFRKATEISIALAMERQFTKDDILEKYLNRIYFGNRAYGIRAAAKTYFGKEDLHELELHEMASLAAIPKAPSHYNPMDNPERAKQRRDTVLALMAQQNIITEQQKLEAQQKEVVTVGKSELLDKFPTYMDAVLREASEAINIDEELLYRGGYRIYTTLDPKAQQALEDAYRDKDNFPEDGPKQQVQSAMVIVNNEDGGIAAIIGGRDYARKGTNRATAGRQPGSSFKPIAVFAPAIETGRWDPYSFLDNERKSFNGYSPRNLDGKYGGQMTMFDAVRRSVNVPAVWLLNEMGVGQGMEFANKLGMQLGDSDRNLAIALGGLTDGVSPLQMARAYSAFAQAGTLHKTHVITKITDASGRTVHTFEPEDSEAMSPQTAWYTTLLLKNVVTNGTGTKAKVANHDVAGKTGTTQSGIEGVGGNRDVWFVGYTSGYTAAVWMGFDHTDADHVMSDYSGVAASLFSKVMTKTLEGREPSKLTRPDNVKELTQQVGSVSGLTAEYVEEDGEIQIGWTPLEGGLEYRLYRKSSVQENYVQIVATSKNLVRDMSIVPGLTYSYYVVAYHPAHGREGERSETVETTVPEEEQEEQGGELPELPEQTDDGEDGGEPQSPGGSDGSPGTDEPDGADGGDGEDSGGGDAPGVIDPGEVIEPLLPN